MKLRVICESKIHHAIVTAADLDYVGSIGIDATLMDLTGIVRGEQVAVWNVNNGRRIETYAIPLAAGSGAVIVNGAAAHHFSPGDRIIVAAFCLTDEPVDPQMIVVNDQNRFVRYLEGTAAAEDLIEVPSPR
ncbi:MAG: aspartate 1-decarboxylase [Acidobacteria bacterium]|nr:aspartate 1-decarboxylase [Acidobacteriota bacterium]